MVAKRVFIQQKIPPKLFEDKGQVGALAKALRHAYEQGQEFLDECIDKDRIILAQGQEIGTLKADITTLNKKLERAAGGKQDVSAMDTAVPKTYAAFEAWRRVALDSDYVVFSKDALKGIRESAYVHPESVFLALLALQIVARMNMGHGDKIKLSHTLNEFFKAGHLEDRRSITPTAAGRYGADYYATDEEGERHFLNHHLCRGADHSETNCMRIYYAHRPDGSILVGKATKHLTNSMT